MAGSAFSVYVQEQFTQPRIGKRTFLYHHNIGFLTGIRVAAILRPAVDMRFPRGSSLKLPVKKNPGGGLDPERLSFFIVIAFFSIFAVIVLVELYYHEGSYYDPE